MLYLSLFKIIEADEKNVLFSIFAQLVKTLYLYFVIFLWNKKINCFVMIVILFKVPVHYIWSDNVFRNTNLVTARVNFWTTARLNATKRLSSSHAKKKTRLEAIIKTEVPLGSLIMHNLPNLPLFTTIPAKTLFQHIFILIIKILYIFPL